MKFRSAVLSLAAVASFATAAYAAVTFDTNTGMGWVGKGDVQTVFGWANRTMQANHTQVTFEYEQTAVYGFDCEWYTGSRNVRRHEISVTRAFQVGASILSDSRRTGQWTGWHLNGFSSGAPGALPDESTLSCNGNPEGDGYSGEKTVVAGSVELQSASGGLYAVFGGDKRLLQ